MHPRYQEWLSFIFDHEVTDPEWYRRPGSPDFEGSEADYATLIGETFRNSGRDLQRFSDAQVNQGIQLIVSPGNSDFIFALRDGSAPLAVKVDGIRSIVDLYRDCFAPRCTEILSDRDEAGGSPLNAICYMFWDICPLSYLRESRERAELAEAVLWTLEQTLKIEHRACREGALHGLSENAYAYPERVAKVIERFLSTHTVDPVLRGYAERAARGGVL
jgi:hypothetical protein